MSQRFLRIGLLILFAATAPLAAQEKGSSNRLIRERSPYLLQHAHNPVDWYPWGEEAFARAKQEDKPVFLSIGYSTCHWCHVMARETFSNSAIAGVLNAHFISVKVDREERPDVDALYLGFLEATRGEGGWPANVFLTPDGTPFFGGTYYPPEARGGLPGFGDLIMRIAGLWETDRTRLETAGAQVLAILKSGPPVEADELPGGDLAERAVESFARRFRPETGGFGSAPRFPDPSVHQLLLRYAWRKGKNEIAGMSLETLTRMARGGIHDPVAGGFHRYTTDENWRVPHFEKMLYDQAQLASLYFDAWRFSGDSELLRAGTGTLDFVLRELTAEGHGFHSALDAMSPRARGREPIEGGYYTWTPHQFASLFPDEKDLALALAAFSVRDGGNVPDELDPSGELRDFNVLNRERSVDDLAQEDEMEAAEVRRRLERIHSVLLAARNRRPRPSVDDKILTGWNGLMISAFSSGYEATGDALYLKAATGAASFLEMEMWDARHESLWRVWRLGERGVPAFAEDYAFFIRGLLDLYAASFDVRWLDLARRLQLRQDVLFWSEELGLYSSSGDRADAVKLDLTGRIDAAVPSHNSISVFNLLELAQITGNDDWNARARSVLTAYGPRLSSNPGSVPMLLAALETARAKPKQIIVAGDPAAKDTSAILSLVRQRYLPDSIVLLADGAAGQKKLASWLPSFESIRRIDGKATVYVCENFICKRPTNDLAEIAKQLEIEKAGG